ncbi:hypothetical protein GcLGCM259_1194 [Glutamicibacter creatinolyticus]|uniref:Uncharacterized protein n=1 Tax=Glutamicibacter creatinolyticus TaxID=162496 RepID=A0A5B7WUG8_9MICC|nr:hypothetical protein GcLGCM259_1194 [Glutamicibacter creatinolyticus]
MGLLPYHRCAAITQGRHLIEKIVLTIKVIVIHFGNEFAIAQLHGFIQAVAQRKILTGPDQFEILDASSGHLGMDLLIIYLELVRYEDELNLHTPLLRYRANDVINL